MAIINFEQMKANEPNRNFDNVDVDENYNIGMQNGAGLYGAAKFFGLVQKAVNWLSSISGNKNFTGVVSMNDKKVATEEKAGELIATALTGYPTNSQTDAKISTALGNLEQIGKYYNETDINLDTFFDNFSDNKFSVINVRGKSGGLFGGGNYTLLVTKVGKYLTQTGISYSSTSNKAYMRQRGCINGTWGNWEKVIMAGDLTSYQTKLSFNGTPSETNKVVTDSALSDGIKDFSKTFVVKITYVNNTTVKILSPININFTSMGDNDNLYSLAMDTPISANVEKNVINYNSRTFSDYPLIHFSIRDESGNKHLGSISILSSPFVTNGTNSEVYCQCVLPI